MTNITLTGTGFQAGATVTVGGLPCGNVNVVSPTQLSCDAPPRAKSCGAQPVVVTNSDNQSATGNLYTYRPASIAFGAITNLSGSGVKPYSIIAADFNSDGLLDLATTNVLGNNVSIYLASSGGSFSAAANFAVGMMPQKLAVGDLNGNSS